MCSAPLTPDHITPSLDPDAELKKLLPAPDDDSPEEGELDEDHHRSTIGGWRFEGLPWEQC